MISVVRITCDEEEKGTVCDYLVLRKGFKVCICGVGGGGCSEFEVLVYVHVCTIEISVIWLYEYTF